MRLRLATFCYLFIAFSFQIDAQNLPSVGSVTIRGNIAIKEAILKSQMNTRPKTFLERLTFWKPAPAYLSPVLEDDISRLRNYYVRHGYPAVVISHQINPAKEGRKIRIDIEIKEGDPVIVNDIRWNVLKDSTENLILQKGLQKLPVAKGNVFTDHELFASENRIVRAFSDNGYPRAKISRTILVNPDTSLADIRFAIQPGPRTYFGELSITGDSQVPRQYILQHVTFKPGTLFSSGAMDVTQRRLSSLDMFRFVTVRAATDSINNNRAPVTIRVSELPRWSLKTGVGYGAEDKLRISLSVTKRGFLGGARKLIFSAKHSWFEPANFSFRFIQPNFPVYNVDMAINPFYLHERERSYEVKRLGTAFAFQYPFSGKSSAWLNWSVEQSNVNITSSDFDPETLKDFVLLNNKSGFTLGTTLDKSDDLFDPTRGWKFSGNFTWMGPAFLSRLTYTRLILDGSKYHHVGAGVHLAARIRAGLMQPTGSSRVTPIEDRFLLGGANSLRGWARNRITPAGQGELQLGGNSMLEAGLELRLPVYEIFGAALFADAGNVWKDAFEHDVTDLLYSAGIGLRVKTPIGPGRIDLAVPLTEKNFRTQLFITIGHAF